MSYYKLNIGLKSNDLIYSKEHEAISSLGQLDIKFTAGITCERMDHISLGKLLVCFYEIRSNKGEISISIFNPENNFEIISFNSTNYISNSDFLVFIKSAISNNYKKSFVCYLLNSGVGAYCFFYTIDDNSYTKPIEYSTYCTPYSVSFKAFFFPLTNKFLFACGTSDSFNFFLFNEEDSKLFLETEKTSIQNCFGYNSFSISFSSNDLKYLMITDTSYGIGDKRTRIYTIENIKNVTIFSSFSESIQTSDFYSSYLSSLNNTNSLLSNDKMSTIPFLSNSISYTMMDNYPISSSFLFSSSTFLHASSSLSPTSLYNSFLSSTSIHNSTKSSSFSFSTNIMHSISNSISISINNNSNFVTSLIKNSDLSSIFDSSSLISFNSNLKCDKYLNYERNKCIDFIPLGFYLYDKTKGLIEKCHESCNSCMIGPNDSSSNCNQCKNNSYYLENGNCIINILCPSEKPLFNKKINECVGLCSVEEILKRKCIINRVDDDSLEIINKNIRQIIYNLTMNDTIDIIIEGNNIIYQISTTNIVKNNKNNNISSIDFGNCENKIKEEYKTEYIIIQKTDINYNNKTIVKYELYDPNHKEEKIDLKICKGDNIQIYTPLDITNNYIHNYFKLYEQGYNILNQNDSFYNDICTQFTSDFNTDMNLFDRKTGYYIANLTSCEIGCSYKGVNMKQKNLQCECPINIEQNDKISNFKLNKEEIINSFYKINEYSNFKVIKCYKLVFSEKGQLNNIGSYFLILIILLYILCGIRYFSNDKMFVANLIKLVLKSINSGEIILFHKSNPLKRKFSLQDIKKDKKEKGIKSIFEIKKENKDNKESSKYSLIGRNKLLKLKGNKPKNKNSSSESDIKIIGFKKKGKIRSNFIRTSSISNQNKNNNYNDEELNKLEYEEALIIDKRGYLKYYCSLLRRNNLVIFTFFQKTDYNLPLVKYSLFLISLSLYFVVNAFFFVDSTIHKIYEHQGMVKLFLEVPKALYSSIISVFCNLFINSLALSEKSLLKLKKIKDKNKRDSSSAYLYVFLRRKITIYFVIGFVFLIFFWYFISAFCAVYKNTQVIYLKNCSISFCISMLYPFLISLVPGLFRIPSLKSGKDKILYGIGNILAFL